MLLNLDIRKRGAEQSEECSKNNNNDDSRRKQTFSKTCNFLLKGKKKKTLIKIILQRSVCESQQMRNLIQ